MFTCGNCNSQLTQIEIGDFQCTNPKCSKPGRIHGGAGSIIQDGADISLIATPSSKTYSTGGEVINSKPPASLDDDHRRAEAARQVESEGGIDSHLKALASAKHWCLEAKRREAAVEYWKERAEAAERLVSQPVFVFFGSADGYEPVSSFGRHMKIGRSLHEVSKDKKRFGWHAIIKIDLLSNKIEEVENE